MMIRNMDGTACIHAYAFTYNSIIGRLHGFSNLFLSLWSFFCIYVVYFLYNVYVYSVNVNIIFTQFLLVRIWHYLFEYTFYFR